MKKQVAVLAVLIGFFGGSIKAYVNLSDISNIIKNKQQVMNVAKQEIADKYGINVDEVNALVNDNWSKLKGLVGEKSSVLIERLKKLGQAMQDTALKFGTSIKNIYGGLSADGLSSIFSGKEKAGKLVDYVTRVRSEATVAIEQGNKAEFLAELLDEFRISKSLVPTKNMMDFLNDAGFNTADLSSTAVNSLSSLTAGDVSKGATASEFGEGTETALGELTDLLKFT